MWTTLNITKWHHWWCLIPFDLYLKEWTFSFLSQNTWLTIRRNRNQSQESKWQHSQLSYMQTQGWEGRRGDEENMSLGVDINFLLPKINMSVSDISVFSSQMRCRDGIWLNWPEKSTAMKREHLPSCIANQSSLRAEYEEQWLLWEFKYSTKLVVCVFMSLLFVSFVDHLYSWLA